MTTHTLEMSPQTLARIGGVIYLIIIIGGIFGEVLVRDTLIVSGDAAATAGNIMASELRELALSLADREGCGCQALE